MNFADIFEKENKFHDHKISAKKMFPSFDNGILERIGDHC